MHCDNLSCVLLLNTGRCKDKLTNCIARNIWLIGAEYNNQLEAVHISTLDNRLPDILSRMNLLAKAQEKLVSELPDNAKRVMVQGQAFELDFSI